MGNINITAAAAIVKCLSQQGITTIFGYPGAAICPFYDALVDADGEQTPVNHILVRHEQNAVHAASGYARITNKPAVCVATSGPGALNLITGIATAYMDSVPLVIITGQVSSELLGRDVFQEADITGAAEPFVKHSYLVNDAKKIPEIFAKAFYIAGSGRPGPVLIDIPVDILKTKINYTPVYDVSINGYKPTITGNQKQIIKVASTIKSSERPLICAGGGIFISDATKELQQLVNATNIPIVTTMMGIGCVSSHYPNYLGMIGMHGKKHANTAMGKADLVILIGARVGDRAVKSPIALSEKATIVHIDIDPAEIGKNMTTHVPIVGDAKNIITSLTEKLDDYKCENWLQAENINIPTPKYTNDKNFVNPKLLVNTLSKMCEDNATLCADVGQNQIWSCNNFDIKNGRLLTSGGMGTMGYSIPAAIGAKFANKSSQVIAICGDGSFQMQSMELATIKANNLGVKIIVMSNGRLGMVRELQDMQYNHNKVAVFLDGNPDFTALATAYGIKTRKLQNDNDIDEVLQDFLSDDTPYLLECVVSPDESTL